MNAYMPKILCWKVGVRKDTKMDDSLVSLIEIMCRGTGTMLKEHREGLIRGNEGFAGEAFFEPWCKEGYSQVKGKARRFFFFF